MNLSNLVHSSVGFVHLLFAVLAMITGTMVLAKTKGTSSHRKIGYAYCFCMLGLNISAFLIYRLFGKFGIFHWMAILSLVTISAGMLPMISKKAKHYIIWHYNFMYWSVIGLYAAFMAETLVRFPDVVIVDGVPNTVFYNATGIASGIVMTIGVYFSIKKKKDWSKFDKTIQDTE